MIVGLVAGALVTYTVELLELHLTIDDPGGTISVHVFGGIWGVLAVAFLAKSPAPNQWLAQVAGVSTLLGLVLPLTYLITLLQNRISPMRTASEGERQGLDLHELGAGAYPDFMTHND
jgi:Amt family ammonium transporter